MKTYSHELLSFPDIAVSRRGRDKIRLKIARDGERIWITDDGLIVHEIDVKGHWKVYREYHASESVCADLFRVTGCLTCSGEGEPISSSWRFCPQCGAKIPRRSSIDRKSIQK